MTGLLARRGTGEVVRDDLSERRHVRDGHDDVEVPLLLRGGRDDVDIATASEEAPDLFDGANRRGQPDPLRRAVEEGVEALEAEREVGATLGAGHRVDLVDDDRVDAA